MSALMREPAVKAPWPPRAENDPMGHQPEPVPVGQSSTQSFYTIAADHGLDPKDLVYYNFLTRDPKEINWYLQEYVGCTKTTRDGWNYTFEGATNDPARFKSMIFAPSKSKPAPVPAVNVDPKTGEGPLPPELSFDGPDCLEFSISKDFPGQTPYILYKLSVAAKGKYKILQEDPHHKFSLSNKDVGFAFAEKIAKDWEISGSTKFTTKMKEALLKKDRKSFTEKLLEATEVGIKSKNNKLGPFNLEAEAGASISKTPFFIKGSFIWEGVLDLTEQIGHQLTLALSVTVTFTARIGFGPALIAILEPYIVGGALILMMPAFVAFGALYYSRAMERARITGNISYYTSGYCRRLGIPPERVDAVILTGDPLAFNNAGEEDAERDAAQFGGIVNYTTALMQVSPGGSAEQKLRNSAGTVRRLLGPRFEEKFGFNPYSQY